ncbi:hypothetical protein GCM10010124_23310 [Pilimelia terevasa]|uniref:Polysaccharide biosynthesis protein CapD-like domain-containing protein n=1 Tax=Pilimelia terevasa TaxID=53372 RepID=A0A8J3BKZ8_9ACTN|nr:polysaccharide biosynthesis protein [Pilimelia terevasa]GGK29918.1 hypothetical protein GCM10010124_23310 [Pilimelia terevasa]
MSVREPTAAPATGWVIPDALAWTAGLGLGAALDLPHHPDPFVVTAAVAFGLHQVLLRALPPPRLRRTAAREAAWLGATLLVTAALLVALALPPAGALLDPGAVGLGCAVAAALMLGGRAGWRYRRRGAPSARTPVLLYGTAASAAALARLMRTDAACRYRPVGLVPDHPVDVAAVDAELPVVGDRADVGPALAATGARLVVLTSPVPPDRLDALCRRARAAGAAVQPLPETNLLIEGADEPGAWDVTSLLGRAPVHTDLAGGTDYLTGKRVLVIGAGGSIGAELCRQIARLDPAELMLLDRDESALHATQLSMSGRALLDGRETILADIRDAAGLRRVVADRRPDVVFHAAALKHLPMLETHPAEAVKTNILGTRNVLAACADVARFVNISTDKAANPTSVLGWSKRITERLTAHAAREAGGTFLSVRFGNVLGSRGSVLTAFRAQLRAGSPVTVTHPEVTRYFMTVREAVGLVIQAAEIGRAGEALILEMGPPVRIVDVARQMGEMMGRQPDIVYTGLRPGEKIHEDLFGAGERDVRPIHPMVSHVAVPALDPALLRLLDPYGDEAHLRAVLAELCAVPDPAAPDPASPHHATGRAAVNHAAADHAAAGPAAPRTAAAAAAALVHDGVRLVGSADSTRA